MLLNYVAVLLAVLFLSKNSFAEISDLTASPVPAKSEVLNLENKSPEIPLTDVENLDFREEQGLERVYNKDNTPFSGALQKRDDEGLLITYFYRNGYKHGIASARAEDGHLELETTYRKGYKDGEEISFYENGKPRLKQTFSQNILNGEEISYYTNGNPERVNHYLDGKLDGETIYLDRNGNTTKIEHYKNGKKNGVEHIIVDNMLKEENNYVDDVLQGITKKFDKQFLVEEIAYENGKRNGISKRYLENGSWSELNYKNDLLNGTAKSFYPDKKIAEIVNYADNQRNGLAEKFNQNGIRISSENYKNGKLEGISRKFTEDGDLSVVTHYVGGNETAVTNIDENKDLRDIYALYKQNKLNNSISNKTLWYPILWLGINLEKTDILNALDDEMKMYSSDIADFSVFERESKSKFETYNRRLFYGLTPLSYAVNITAPTEILQKFASQAENIDMQNPRGTTALIEAVRLNNLQMVKYLLAHQADVSAVYRGGNTILLYALKEKAQNDIVSELLKAGADVNASDINGQTPIAFAIAENNAELVDLLLQNNADIKQKKQNGKNILAYAFENNASPEIILRLIAAGADVNAVDDEENVLLIQALASEKYDIAELFLQSGADINLQNKSKDSALSYVLSHDISESILTTIIKACPTPLKNLPKFDKPLWKILAEQNRYDLLGQVINTVGGINTKDENGETLFGYFLQNPNNEKLRDMILSSLNEMNIKENSNMIFEAIDAKNLEILKKLVDLGANVNAKNDEGVTVLNYLLDNNYPLEYIETIETKELNINESRALETAVLHDDVALAQNLIKHGADVNLLTADSEKTKARESYLMILNYNQNEMAKLLLDNGADINYVPEPDKTMLMYAVKTGNETLISYLLENGFSVDQADSDGNTAIMYIADMLEKYAELPTEQVNDLLKKIVPILQRKGADISIQNNNGETLLIKIAKQKLPNYVLILNTLIEFGANANKKDQYGKKAADYAK